MYPQLSLGIFVYNRYLYTMKDDIRLILKKYITEQKKSWIEEHCDNSFTHEKDRYFCYAATNTFKSDNDLQKNFKKKLREFVLKNQEKIGKISFEILKKDSEIAKNGFEEFKWVNDNGQSLCPNIREKMIDVYNKLLGEQFDLYLDDNGKYHIVNRLDTNYSALGVMFTEYFRNKDIPKSLDLRGFKSKKSLEKPVEYLIKSILYPVSHHPNNYESTLLRNIKVGKDPLDVIFNDLLTDRAPHISEKVIQTLTKVREAGFETERKFMELLDSHGIEKKNFGKDYGFVDRFLGIDLFVKLQGEWYPVQVKSSEREKTLVDTLGCEGSIVVYPDWKGSFIVNRFTFERFFCKMMHACKSEHKKNSDDIQI